MRGEVQNWLKCIAQNYGSESLKQGAISGYKVTTPVTVDPLTKLISTRIFAYQQGEVSYGSRPCSTPWPPPSARMTHGAG